MFDDISKRKDDQLMSHNSFENESMPNANQYSQTSNNTIEPLPQVDTFSQSLTGERKNSLSFNFFSTPSILTTSSTPLLAETQENNYQTNHRHNAPLINSKEPQILFQLLIEQRERRLSNQSEPFQQHVHYNLPQLSEDDDQHRQSHDEKENASQLTEN
ncbi:hypothetical protein HI914_05734 [Erysiphe necator]|nr:hypothetical protein HI914_05734 [Erysiphe necator]